MGGYSLPPLSPENACHVQNNCIKFPQSTIQVTCLYVWVQLARLTAAVDSQRLFKQELITEGSLSPVARRAGHTVLYWFITDQ